MKILRILLFALVASLLASCSWSGYFPGNAVVGNGNVVEEARSLSGYASVHNAGVFNVHITQGNEETFRVRCDENLLPLLQTRVENGTLYISMTEKSVRPTEPAHIYVQLKQLETLKNEGVGNLDVTEVSGESLQVNNSGVGNLKLNIHYSQVECRNMGVGNVELSGSTKSLQLINKGVGNVNASEINPDTARVENAGVGNVTVRCSGELSIVNQGVGSVRYMGEAVIKDIVSQGVGSIKRASD